MNKTAIIPSDSPQRALPDFAVIGAMRAGTTLLHNLLDGLSDVSLPNLKETDFFIEEKNFGRGRDWYARQFDQAAKLCGEVSPNYSKRDVFGNVSERLYASNPNAKIIYIVRDPVERAISHYSHSLITGQKLPYPESLLDTPEGQHIIDASRYFWQLEPWIARFGKQQILISDFTQLTIAPDTELPKIFEFLGIECAKQPSFLTNANSRKQVASAPNWWHKMRETGVGHFVRSTIPRKHAEKLKRLISSANPQPALPDITETFRMELKSRLLADTVKFRAHTGLNFSHWTI